jgi:sigma-B regulation protein RsbU (phosphoserine phosphatase)
VKHALLRTLPGRAIVIGLAIKLAVFLLRTVAGQTPASVGVLDTAGSVAVACGGGYFLVRGMAFVRRRLLWRVRRKLIISYIFIGFVPAILIIAFFLLGGVLLFSNFSSYLVQNRFRVLGERAASIAATTASEIQHAGGRDVAGILARRQAAVAGEFPGASFAVVPMNRPCGSASSGTADARGAPSAVPDTAGPWSHVEPPATVPAWVTCGGFVGLLAYEREGERANGGGGPPVVVDQGPAVNVSSNDVHSHALIRAIAFPESRVPGYGVVVDLLINEHVRQQLRQETGAELTDIRRVSRDVAPLRRRADDPDEPPAAGPNAFSLNQASVTFLEYVDWTTGKRGGVLMVPMRLSIGEIYQRISSQGFGDRTFGQALFLVLVIIGVLFLIIEAAALVTGLALARSITGSVHELFAGTERVRQGDFTHKITVMAPDQLGELAGSFNLMTSSIEDLMLQAAEKKRLEEELRIAHEIQMSLLPQGPLRMPGMSVTALCVPAREVGGDYYDFLPLDDHRVGVLIADVSGKGTSAALYMAELKGLVLSLSRIHTSPRELLIAADRIIAPHLDARSFITMTYALVDLKTKTMTYARAGHTPLIYLPGPAAGSPRVQILAPDGLVLGLKLDDGEMFERLLEEKTIPLRPGDLYLFFTDGITEAMNAGDDCFGEGRLGELLQAHADLPPDQLRERVLREIASFVGDAPQHDDMTMILLKIEDVGAAAVSRASDADFAVTAGLVSATRGAGAAPARVG